MHILNLFIEKLKETLKVLTQDILLNDNSNL